MTFRLPGHHPQRSHCLELGCKSIRLCCSLSPWSQQGPGLERRRRSRLWVHYSPAAKLGRDCADRGRVCRWHLGCAANPTLVPLRSGTSQGSNPMYRNRSRDLWSDHQVTWYPLIRTHHRLMHCSEQVGLRLCMAPTSTKLPSHWTNTALVGGLPWLRQSVCCCRLVDNFVNFWRTSRASTESLGGEKLSR